jgi:EAL domain-containing protein (putative c-di-GMP-specific phosphodiesterase class I)
VAEGVENDAQRDYLLRTGCDATQGYGFSRPLPQDEFLALLREQSPVPAL